MYEYLHFMERYIHEDVCLCLYTHAHHLSKSSTYLNSMAVNSEYEKQIEPLIYDGYTRGKNPDVDAVY